MTQPTLEKIRQTRAELADAAAELTRIQAEVLEAPTFDFRQAILALKDAREAKRTLGRQLARFCARLPDGRELLRPQLEALKTFAANNRIALSKVLRSVTIDRNVIVEADFQGLRLKTLEGLTGLWSLKLLDVTGNKSLTTLRGIPTESMESLFAWRCDLTGDLSDLSAADRLEVIFLSHNPKLSSLKGLPTQRMRVVDASACGLEGDLSELSGATRLEELCVNENPQIVSLRGIPPLHIQEVYAAACGLAGDLSELATATKLKILGIAHNKSLSSLTGISTQKIEFIDARSCSLSGNHDFLLNAPHLKELKLEKNSYGLHIDTFKARQGMIITL